MFRSLHKNLKFHRSNLDFFTLFLLCIFSTWQNTFVSYKYIGWNIRIYSWLFTFSNCSMISISYKISILNLCQGSCSFHYCLWYFHAVRPHPLLPCNLITGRDALLKMCSSSCQHVSVCPENHMKSFHYSCLNVLIMSELIQRDIK